MKHQNLFPSRRLHYQRGYWFHNLIVAIDRLDLIPAPVAVLAALALPFLASLAWPAHRGLALGLPTAALLIEAAALLSSRLPGRSPSPFAGPLLLFALGHAGATAVVAFAASLLPPTIALLLHAALQAGLLAAMLYAFFIEPYRVGLRWEEVELKNSANKFAATSSSPNSSLLTPNSFLALLITDLHLDVRGPREATVLAHARAVRPDLILIPGDLTNLSTVDCPDCAADAVAFLQDLRALAPVFVSLGTPEVDDREWIRSLCEPAGAVLLDGTCADFPADSPAFTLIGVTAAGPIDPHRVQLQALMADVRLPAVLLYHTPDLIEAAAAAGVALQLSGHTHGGQIRLPLIGSLFTASRYGRRFASGRYQVGPTALIVSRGVGLEGAGAPRLRFLCPPEVVAIKIRIEK